MHFAKTTNGVLSFDFSSATKHGLIAGATGTGKTVTVKKLCEIFSEQGISVFVTDIKGDLGGFQSPGEANEKFTSFVEERGLSLPDFHAFPTTFWDIYAQHGIALRASVSEIGPLLMSRLLGLNETQTGVMYSIFKLADDEGLFLIDFKDLDMILKFVNEHRKELSASYGNLHPSTLGAIQRQLLMLERQGLDQFLGEPALDLRDFIRTDVNGRGMINILDARAIYTSPDLYSACILYLLSELFENLPEVGDVDQPKLVFFFEEAHLLFNNASKELLQKIEQVVKLIRSKGVGIFFITQNPRDIPDNVIAQLGSKIQHALRAYTPLEQKQIQSIADAFRTGEDMDLEAALVDLKIGEALISLLDENGVPNFVQRAFIFPPSSKIGAQEIFDQSDSLLYKKYAQVYDGESAYEMLLERQKNLNKITEQEAKEAVEEKTSAKGGIFDILTSSKKGKDTPMDRMIKSTMGSVGSTIGRSLVRGILGTLTGKK